jgi:hypothetical protein
MALAITSYTPTTGPTAGGTLCTITGTQLDTVDVVLVGNKQANIVSKTPTALQFYTPSEPAAGNQTVFVVDEDTNTEVAAATPFAYTATASAETLVSTLARKWKMDVDQSAAQDGSGYIPCRAIMDFQPQVSPTMQDDSDYDSNGWGSDVKTMLKWSNVVKFGRKRGISAHAFDAGQEVLKAAHDKFGAAGVVRVRWYDRDGGPEAYEGFAQVQWSEDGGNASALDGVSVTLTGQGARTTIVNPAGA